MVFSSVRASWGQWTRQWAGMDASSIHQSNGLVARQGKGQETKSQLILGPLHAILVIALLITPVSLIFSHKELLSLTETVMYLEGVGEGGRGTPVVLSTSPRAVPVQTIVRTRKLKSGP